MPPFSVSKRLQNNMNVNNTVPSALVICMIYDLVLHPLSVQMEMVLGQSSSIKHLSLRIHIFLCNYNPDLDNSQLLWHFQF